MLGFQPTAHHVRESVFQVEHLLQVKMSIGNDQWFELMLRSDDRASRPDSIRVSIRLDGLGGVDQSF